MIVNKRTVDKASLVLGDVYESNKARLLDIIYTYKEICNLPEEEKEMSVNKEMFEYCLKRTGLFVIVAVYSPREGIFLLRTILEDGLGWELPGTSIQPSKDTIIQDTVLRVIRKFIPDIEIGELEPVAVIQNIFKYENEVVKHIGLGFMARSRNINNSNLESRPEVQGQFVSDPGKGLFRYANQKIYEFVMNTLKAQPYKGAEGEILSAEEHAWRQRFHKITVSKLFKRSTTNRIRKKLLEIMGPIRGLAFLDASCGENEFVYTVADQDAKLVVANDVSWPTIRFLIKQSKGKIYHNIIFTNHSITALPFSKIFDFVLCKNTLHHMENPDEFHAIIRNLVKACKNKIIIVEIEDPGHSSIVGRLLHRYWYTNFLGDVGHHFFNRDNFREILTDTFHNKVEFDDLKTVKGRYLFAVVTVE